MAETDDQASKSVHATRTVQDVTGSGIVASGDVHLTGENVAGRDIIIAEQHVYQAEPALTALFQLPPDIDDFTDREDSLAHLLKRLAGRPPDQKTAVAIAAIAGKAGIGKTALAIRVAYQLQQQFPDAQLYVDLRGAGTQPLEPAVVLAGFLRALGVEGTRIPETLEDRIQLYRARLAGRRAVVLLDNAISEAQVRPLLPGAPTCAVLITSRRRLAGLEGVQTLPLEVLDVHEAVELLTKVAASERVAADPDAAQRIVRLCGYLPLAIRIAGAKLAARSHWRPSRLAERLGDERRRLGELKVGDLEVRASLALSYDGRDEDQRLAFRLLGLLDAPDFALWVTAALLKREVSEAEDLIEGLVNDQLLEVAGEDGIGQARYRFHDLLRVFARERLEEETIDARRAALEGTLAAYATLAVGANALLEPAGLHDIGVDTSRLWPAADPHDVEAMLDDPLDWFTAERESLVAAVEQAYQAEFWELSWQLAVSLFVFFEVRAYYNDWEHTFKLALAAARRAGTLRGEALVLHGLGRLHLSQERYEAAATCLQRGLLLFREIGDRAGEATTLRRLSYAHWYLGQWEDGLASLEQSLKLFQVLDDQLAAAYVLADLGAYYRSQGHLDRAITCLTACLTTFRELGDRREEAYALRHLGDAYREHDRWDDAKTVLEASVAIFQELNDRRWEPYALLSLATTERDRGNRSAAEQIYRQCLSLLDELGDRRGEALARRELGLLLGGRGRWEEAYRCFDQCVPVFRELGDSVSEAVALRGLGNVYRMEGRWEEAITRFNQCLPILRELQAHLGEAWALESLAMTFAAQGDQAAARVAWQDALAIFRTLGLQPTSQTEDLLVETGRLGCSDHRRSWSI